MAEGIGREPERPHLRRCRRVPWNLQGRTPVVAGISACCLSFATKQTMANGRDKAVASVSDKSSAGAPGGWYGYEYEKDSWVAARRTR